MNFEVEDEDEYKNPEAVCNSYFKRQEDEKQQKISACRINNV
jgi:hypothetical protein